MSTYCVSDSRTLLVKYADDVTLVIPVNKCEFNDLSLVRKEVLNLQSWCDVNGMTINAENTKVLNINMSSNPLICVPTIRNQKLKMSRRLYVLRVCSTKIG